MPKGTLTTFQPLHGEFALFSQEEIDGATIAKEEGDKTTPVFGIIGK